MSARNSSDITRRQALKTMGAVAVVAGLAAVAGRAMAQATPKTLPPQFVSEAPGLGWFLPKLPYDFNALEPHIDAKTMEIHYTKHHQAYINNAKKLIEPYSVLNGKGPELLLKNPAMVPEAIREGVRNNVGGHVNHSFFWTILAPNGGGVPGNTLGENITATFGSFDKFKQQFTDAAMKRFGSGWAWLVAREGKLQVVSTANQDSPISDGATLLLGLDVWEHAYYLHYQNRRADYVSAFWNVVNWPACETYYQATLKG
jgi:Fe-Mn family superoxide dismutase